MPIRMARLEDIPALVEGGRRMHALTRFRHFDYLPEKVARSFEAIITRGQGKYVFMVAENGGGMIVGALLSVVEQHIFSDQLVLNVMHFTVLPESRMGGYAAKLLLALERFASQLGVFEINFSQNSAADTMSAEVFNKFMRRTKYNFSGAAYWKLMQ